MTATTGAFTSTNFGPYTNWTAKAVSVGSDSTTHFLWTNTNGKAALWNVVGGVYQTKHERTGCLLECFPDHGIVQPVQLRAV